MALLLSCESLSKSYGMRPLFSGITLGLFEQERAGLIGPNGAGKSTLLKILAGLEHEDTGVITRRRNLRVGYVAQEDELPAGRTVHQVLVDALHDEHVEEHDAAAQAGILLGKMEFADPDQQVGALSGGWRKRLAIARELIRQPDLLFMDEPTNHLDLQGILWLEKLLKSAAFAFLMISHDRYFLENVTNRVVELNAAYPEGFLSVQGNYSEFLTRKEEFLSAQQAQQQSLAGRVRREIEWLKRGAKARTTKAKGRIQEANRLMDELSAVQTRNAQTKSVQIEFSATERQTRKLVAAQSISKSLGGRVLFEKLDLVLSPKTTLGILGPNGSGKSTLIKVLAGELDPDTGQVRRAEGLRIAYLHQDREKLDKDQPLRLALSPKSDFITHGDSRIHVTSWAKRFLFKPEQLDLPVRELSGGEQARVAIARLMHQPADLLILDEPTNDLDIPSLEVLEESLEEFAGAVVLVSHDRYLLDRLATDILGLDGCGRASLYADVAQWQRAQEPQAKKDESAQRKPASKPTAAPSTPSKRLTYMEQRELEQMEGKILAAEAELADAQHALGDPATLADRTKLDAACRRADAAQAAVTTLYARWEYLETKKQ